MKAMRWGKHESETLNSTHICRSMRGQDAVNTRSVRSAYKYKAFSCNFVNIVLHHYILCSYFLVWFVFLCQDSCSLPVCVWPPSRWGSFPWAETLHIDLARSLLNQTQPETWLNLPQSGSECNLKSVSPLHNRASVTHRWIKHFKQHFHIYRTLSQLPSKEAAIICNTKQNCNYQQL